MKPEAMGKFVCVRIPEEKEEKKGNLYLPETAKKAKEYAYVYSVGGDCKLKLNIGDMIIRNRYGFHPITIDEIKYAFIEEETIAGVLRG